ncbi:DNA-cytosine methyltransferase [Tolypothrix sp. NIES-4075]|nr:DNA cytosine methyltransferase [Tolypothrix sp. NIES-4075]GAX45637.1 DNA-cytosine methyltransferase [Tolypothrix sp. NIES-4075]
MMNSTAPAKKIAVSLFSGVGGFDLGFNAAGFEIAIAIDNNPIALATYQHNFPHATVLCKDIREVTGEEIRACIQTKYVDWDGEIHTVFGGPPCQGFSVAGLQNVEAHIPHPNCHKGVFTEHFLDNESKKILHWVV